MGGGGGGGGGHIDDFGKCLLTVEWNDVLAEGS